MKRRDGNGLEPNEHYTEAPQTRPKQTREQYRRREVMKSIEVWHEERELQGELQDDWYRD